MKKVLAALGTAAVLMTGATACGTQTQDNGYEYVWDHGHYTYVPYDYYQSHRSYYTNSAHKPKHVSSSYVTSHHVTVQHQTTTTKHTTTTRTTRKTTNSGSTKYRTSKRR